MHCIYYRCLLVLFVQPLGRYCETKNYRIPEVLSWYARIDWSLACVLRVRWHDIWTHVRGHDVEEKMRFFFLIVMIFWLVFQKWLVDSKSSSRRPRLRRKLPRWKSSRATAPTTRRRLRRKPWFMSAAYARFVAASCCYWQRKSEITIDFTMYF